MKTERTEQTVIFPELISRPVVVDGQAPRVCSDGGAVLLGRMDRSFGFTKRFASCFTDLRNQGFVEHELLTMIRQRTYGLGLGYEDLNDHEALKSDPLVAAICGHDDVEGKHRRHDKDKGNPLAGKSTLNRFELPRKDLADERYKKVLADAEKIEDFFIREYVRSLDRETTEVILDVDNTDDPLHGEQEGRFFHGYYREYCYTPLYIFDGMWPIVASLRTADEQHLEETLSVIQKIVLALRKRFPALRITLRGDSGFCRHELMTWCEKHNVFYVFGLAGNAVLKRIMRGTMRSAESMRKFNRTESERLYKDFQYRAKDWDCPKRRVIGKAEAMRLGPNYRFIITNVQREEVNGQELYEQGYCARGDMENRLKEQQLNLFADRTSTHWFESNQLRLWFSTLAYLLVNNLRHWGLKNTELAKATCGTIRTKLFKIGAVVKTSARRVLISLSAHHPMVGLFMEVARKLDPGRT